MNTRYGITHGLSLAAAVLVATSGARAKTPAAPAGAPDARALAARIDRHVNQQLAAEKITPSPRAGDAEFLRRVYLDIAGVIPPADKAAAFLDSKDPDKRAKLIDELLASPQYGRHQADIWQALLFQRTSDTRRLQADPLVQWLEKRFNDNLGWDRLVTELVTATGSIADNGAVTFFAANPTPDKLTDMTSKLFLGVQLQCAQCHNHPFTHWKQTEYWGMAAFFTKVRLNGNAKQAAKRGLNLELTEGSKGKPPKLPESAKIVPAKFFQGDEPKLSAGEPYRPVLAHWLTSADNPFFAKAMVNRTWGQFFGRGFVNPVDNMHEENPASHPELLREMADQFAASGFDLKFLIRAVCNSQAYQRTSRPATGNEKDATLFSHMAVKNLSPEQLYDSLTLVLGKAGPGDAAPAGKKAAKGTPAANQQAKQAAQQANQQKKGGGVNQRDVFVNFFQVEEGSDPTEYQAGIPQVLRLMNSGQLNVQNSALLSRVARSNQTPAAAVQQLFLAALSRRPTAAETRKLTAYVARDANHRKAYSDILWALLNSSEFALNH